MTDETKQTVDTFNELLRGERSAVETYRQALEKVDDEPEVIRLSRICTDHEDTLRKIEKHVIELGGEPERDSGSWGAFASAVTGTAKLFGDTSAVKALKEGEEHGLEEYRSAIDNEHLGPDCRELISECIIKQQRHLGQLDQIILSLS